MTDKDVGELWSYYDANDRESRDIHNLIRKLVEERAKTIAMVYFHTNEVDNVNIKSCEAAACRDFGIDPKDFK